MRNEKCKFQIEAAPYCGGGLLPLRLPNKFTIFILDIELQNHE